MVMQCYRLDVCLSVRLADRFSVFQLKNNKSPGALRLIFPAVLDSLLVAVLWGVLHPGLLAAGARINSCYESEVRRAECGAEIAGGVPRSLPTTAKQRVGSELGSVQKRNAKSRNKSTKWGRQLTTGGEEARQSLAVDEMRAMSDGWQKR